MPIRTICPNPGRGKAFRVPDEAVGKNAKCARCQTKFCVRDGLGELIELPTPIRDTANTSQEGSATPQEPSVHVDSGDSPFRPVPSTPPPLPQARSPAAPAQDQAAEQHGPDGGGPVKDASDDQGEQRRTGASARSAAKWCGGVSSRLMKSLRWVFALGWDAARFYGTNAGNLVMQLCDYADIQGDLRNRPCDIRLASGRRRTNAQWNNMGWRVYFPQCCVHCGERAGETINEEKEIPDLRWPLWS